MVVVVHLVLLIWFLFVRDTTSWHPLWNYVDNNTTQAVLVQPDKWLSLLGSASAQLVSDDWTAHMQTIDAMIVWQWTQRNAIFVDGKRDFDPAAFAITINTENGWLPYNFEKLEERRRIFALQGTIDSYREPNAADRLIADPLLLWEKQSFADAIVGMISLVRPEASPLPYPGIVRRLQRSKYFSFAIAQQGRTLVAQADLIYKQTDPNYKQQAAFELAYYDNPALLWVIAFADLVDIAGITSADLYATLASYLPEMMFDKQDLEWLMTSLWQAATFSVYQSIGAEPLSALIQVKADPLWDRIIPALSTPFTLAVETDDKHSDISVWQSIKQADNSRSRLDAPAGTIARILLNLAWIQSFIETSQWLLWPVQFDLSQLSTQRLERLDAYIQETANWLSLWAVLK